MKKIVIAPKITHKELFNLYRKDDPFIDIKFMTKEEVIQGFNYSFGADSILYLIKKQNIDVSLAKKKLKDMSYDIKDISPRSTELFDLKEELISSGLLKKNIYIDYEFKNASIDVHFYSENDAELNYFIKKYNPNYFKYSPRTDFLVREFSDYEDELIFFMNEVSSLIQEGVKPSDIYVYGLSNNYDLIFERIREHFGLYFNNYNPHLLYENRDVRDFFNRLDENNLDELIETINVKDENLMKLKNILVTYRVDTLSFVEQRNIYVDVLNKTYQYPIRYKDGINVIKEPYALEGEHLFILNFNVNKFPKVINDDGYLSNDELKLIGLPALKEKNEASASYFMSLLSTKANLHVYYSLNSGLEKLRPTYFISSLGLKVETDNYFSSLSSNKEARIKLGKAYDIRKNYKVKTEDFLALNSQINLPYSSYKNDFNGVNHYLKESLLKVSYTGISTYAKCGYMYYLDRVLKIDGFKSTFALEKGNIAHKVLERINKDTVKEDYEMMFNQAVSESEYEFNAKELFFLNIFKQYFKRSFNLALDMENNVGNPVFYREKDIDDVVLDEHVILNGKIDKIVLTGKDHEYVTLIDYKSGKEEFKENYIEYGLSLQLPTYSILIDNDPKFKDKEVLGLFIEPLINPDANKICFTDPKYDNGIRLKGVFLNDLDAMLTLDPNLKDGSKYIASAKVKKDETFDGNSRARNKEWFVEKRELARGILLENSLKILNNEFVINPKIIGTNNVSCTYCPYRDICFKRPKDEVLLTSNEDEENE